MKEKIIDLKVKIADLKFERDAKLLRFTKRTVYGIAVIGTTGTLKKFIDPIFNGTLDLAKSNSIILYVLTLIILPYLIVILGASFFKKIFQYFWKATEEVYDNKIKEYEQIVQELENKK